MSCCILTNNTKESFIHLIQSHLDTNTNYLSLNNHNLIDNDVLEELAINPNASAVTNLNCHSTSISYNGIVKLWNSQLFGKLNSEMPTYEKHTGNPIVTITIEVGNTKVINQHQCKLFKYPLPLLRDFEIMYGHKRIGEPFNLFGYKKIVLLNNGEELERNY